MSRNAALACGLVLLLAASGRAQNTSAPTPPAPAASSAPTASVASVPPLQHLTNAQHALAGINEKPLPPPTRKNLAQLRKDFDAMIKVYKAAPANAIAWQNTMYDVERDLVVLIGGGGPDSGDAKAIPGLPAEVSDPPARAALEAYRTHLELFYDAATMYHVLAPAEGGVSP